MREQSPGRPWKVYARKRAEQIGRQRAEAIAARVITLRRNIVGVPPKEYVARVERRRAAFAFIYEHSPRLFITIAPNAEVTHAKIRRIVKHFFARLDYLWLGYAWQKLPTNQRTFGAATVEGVLVPHIHAAVALPPDSPCKWLKKPSKVKAFEILLRNNMRRFVPSCTVRVEALLWSPLRATRYTLKRYRGDNDLLIFSTEFHRSEVASPAPTSWG